jgi:hypothetical protein
VLDIGYGTGYWLSDMRHQYPHSTLMGIDLAPRTWDPSILGDRINLIADFNFEQDVWPFSENQIDLIHVAQLCGSVSDWAKLCSTALR